MTVQCFVFSWGSFIKEALVLEKNLIVAGVNTSVIYSGNDVDIPPHWHHLREDYYSAKWNESVRRFSSDIYLQIMADVQIDRLDMLLERATRALEHPMIGMYEPDVDIGFNFKKELLTNVDDSLYEIPMVDGLTTAMRGNIARALPPVDSHRNRFGWGITPALSAICHSLGLKCVRDYQLATKHKPERSYPRENALLEREDYIGTLPPNIQEELVSIYARMRRVSVRRFF